MMTELRTRKPFSVSISLVKEIGQTLEVVVPTPVPRASEVALAKQFASIVIAWPHLAPEVRRAILAMIAAASVGGYRT